MKKYTRFAKVVACAILFGNVGANAQIVGTDVFLQGRYLEIGMQANGSFGTTTCPAGYHPNSTAPSTALAEVYDMGHDGWTTGTPAFLGDYTYQGYPLEGWELQVGSGRSQAMCPSAGFSTGGTGSTLAGTVTGYSNSGGTTVANWAGTEASGQLAITMDTRVDTNASWVIMTVKMYNTGATDLSGVYYMRHCDPDIDFGTSPGAISTQNIVTYQNDAFSRVLVSSTGPITGGYMGLGTTDGRAKAFYSNSWPIPVTTDLATVYDETASLGATYTVGVPATADQAVGLIFNLGTIAAGDSAVIAYSYSFNDATGLDSVNTTLCGGPLVAGTIVPNTTTACPGTMVSFSLTGESAYSVTTYQWQASPDNTTWTDLSGATATSYNATSFLADTYFRCRVMCTASGASVFTPSQLITFTPVCPCPTLTAGIVTINVTTACSTTAITLDATGYSSTGATFQWQSAPDGATWSDIPGATTVPYSFTGITADTYYRLVVTCASGTSVASTSQIIIFDPLCGSACAASAGIVVSSVAVACSTTIINLSDVGYTTTGTTAQWQASLDSMAWTDIAATSVPYTFSGLIATTYYRLKVICTSTGDAVTSPGRRIIYNPSCGGSTTTVASVATDPGEQLYPNPVIDELVIAADPAAYKSFIITNNVGQKLLQQEITSAKTSVSVQSLPSGIYYITLKGENGAKVQKFVKW